jgi:hypothetical protein
MASVFCFSFLYILDTRIRKSKVTRSVLLRNVRGLVISKGTQKEVLDCSSRAQTQTHQGSRSQEIKLGKGKTKPITISLYGRML